MLQISSYKRDLREKGKAPDQRADRSGEFSMGWLISFPPLALIAESSNLFPTNTINCGIGDFVSKCPASPIWI